jgi:hypothetical protein
MSRPFLRTAVITHTTGHQIQGLTGGLEGE